jgi:hypothetical protein
LIKGCLAEDISSGVDLLAGYVPLSIFFVKPFYKLLAVVALDYMTFAVVHGDTYDREGNDGGDSSNPYCGSAIV